MYGYQWKYQSSDVEIKDITKERYAECKVYIYYLDGTYYREFKNKKEATKVLYPQDITRSVPNRIFDNIYNNEYFGYRWTREYYERLPELIKINKGVKPVVQIDNNKVINIFETGTKACSYLKANRNGCHAIYSCCKNKVKSAYGYKWKYIQDIDESLICDSFLLEKYKNFMFVLNDLYKEV